MMQYYQTKFGFKWTSSLEDKVQFFAHLSPLCDLNIEDSETSLCTTLRLMIIHYHTKFA